MTNIPTAVLFIIWGVNKRDIQEIYLTTPVVYRSCLTDHDLLRQCCPSLLISDNNKQFVIKVMIDW